VATLNQPQYAPWPMEEQVVALFAANEGYLDEIPVSEVPRFQEELREFVRADGTIYTGIRESGDIEAEIDTKLREDLDKFRRGFNVGDEGGTQ
jgi:F-type H+-transporting ATPase subunit alpha